MAHCYKDECGTFQNEVYTIICENTKCSMGCYPNFQKAYERLEELAKGNPIVDCGDNQFGNSCLFEIIDIKKCKYGMTVNHDKYRIYRNLLTIREDDELVTLSLTMKLQKENKMRQKSKYKLNTEVL